jgi:hypothetical protein
MVDSFALVIQHLKTDQLLRAILDSEEFFADHPSNQFG